METAVSEECNECAGYGFVHMDEPFEIERCDYCQKFATYDAAADAHDTLCDCGWPREELREEKEDSVERKLNIQIIGRAGAGKTIIAKFLQVTLKQSGFETNLDDGLDDPPSSYSYMNSMPITDQLAVLQKNNPVQISIETHQVRKMMTPGIVLPLTQLRSLHMALSNAREQIKVLGTPTDEVNEAHLKELDGVMAMIAPYLRVT